MIEREGPSGTAVIVLLAITGILIALQYTPYALFGGERTSMLWGVFVGLVIGGFLFRWLRFKNETSE
jgi:hypothetical protein